MNKSFYLRALIAVLVAVSYAIACNKEEDAPGNEASSASVSFVINGNGWSGSFSDPIMVETGDTLNMTLSQKSSYTDTDGKVYTCEPKATISLYARKDTLYVKDLATLTSIKHPSDPTTTSSGTNPELNVIKQVFDIGGQELAVDLSYEVYRYVSATNKTIEMPYIKPHLPSIADGVVDIKLVPTDKTRGIVLRDSTFYKAIVSFNLDVESKNTDDDKISPLSFELEYIAVVEDVTELPDPSLEFSYQLNILGGTTSTASPFELTKGEQLSLEWIQNSRYTYFSATELSGKTITQKPKATVNVSVLHDTLRVETIHELEKAEELPVAEETSGEEPTKHVTKQSFKVGEQVISIDWSYETFAPLDVEGEQVLLPYLELGKAELVNMNFTEIQGAKLPNEADKAYEVIMRFRQKLTGVHTAENISEDIEYVVKYIAVLENKIISTTYEKDYGWQEAHDNLRPASYYLVRRIRTYANGDKITDTFVEGGRWAVDLSGYIGLYSGGAYREESVYHYNDDITFVYHAAVFGKNNDYSVKIHHKTGVPDISRLSLNIDDSDDWEKRNRSHYQYIGNTFYYNPDDPVDGWYVRSINRARDIYLDFLSADNSYMTWIESYQIIISFYDRFLYLDGKVFDFSEFRPTYESNTREEPITLADGTPAKRIIHELKCKYLGRDYDVAISDTVYQLPK